MDNDKNILQCPLPPTPFACCTYWNMREFCVDNGKAEREPGGQKRTRYKEIGYLFGAVQKWADAIPHTSNMRMHLCAIRILTKRNMRSTKCVCVVMLGAEIKERKKNKPI